jgi:hypothetical protein
MLGSTTHARVAPLPAPYLALSLSAPLLAVVLLMVMRSTLGLGTPASDRANLVVSVPPTEAHIFELQVAAQGCSIQQVDALPGTPPPASSGSIYVYAGDLYETYSALCRGSTEEGTRSS